MLYFWQSQFQYEKATSTLNDGLGHRIKCPIFAYPW